jgi:hypothetical protein
VPRPELFESRSPTARRMGLTLGSILTNKRYPCVGWSLVPPRDYVEGVPFLRLHMRREGLPKQEHDRRKCRPKQSITSNSDFYSMARVRPKLSPAATPANAAALIAAFRC